MQISLAELAAMVGGTVVGDETLSVSGAATISDAQPGDITLADSENKGAQLSDSSASAAIISREMEPPIPAIQVDDVHKAFAAVVLHFRPARKTTRIGISAAAVIHPTARVADDVDIHPLATIGEDVEIATGSTIHSGVQIMAGSKIGPNVTIFPNVVLYEDTVVGARSILHSGVVLGAYGFGYEFVDGHHQLSAQLGNVVIGEDVEIGANTTVDRGTYGSTTIGDGTKIDDKVMVAHNCHIGKHNMLCSQVGIAGSTSTGDYVVMAGQVGVRDHVHIGDRAVLGAMAGIVNNVPDDARMLGIPATPEREQKLKQAAWAKLPEMRREFKKLRVTVKELVEQAEQAKSPDAKSPDANSSDANSSDTDEGDQRRVA